MGTMLHRTIASLSLGALMAGGAVALVATPASAAWNSCTANYACMWKNQDYPNGPNALFASALPGLSTSDNLIKSVVNRGYTSSVRFYDGSDYTGDSFLMNHEGNTSGVQWRDPFLANGTDTTSVNWSNKITSGRFW